MTRSQQIRQLIQDALREMPKGRALGGLSESEDAPPGNKLESERATPKNKPESEGGPPKNKPAELVTMQRIADMEANRELRGRHAKDAYRLARACLVMWWIVVLVQGVGKAFFEVEVWDSTVMIAITTGVTVNVLAAFLGVIRGLFGKNG